MIRPRTSSFKQSCWTAALALALLFAQFAGLQHRIQHGGRSVDARAASVQTESNSSQIMDPHSCAAFDAQTLGNPLVATLCIPFFSAVAFAFAGPLLLTSWLQPVFHYFLSRAPPPDAL